MRGVAYQTFYRLPQPRPPPHRPDGRRPSYLVGAVTLVRDSEADGAGRMLLLRQPPGRRWGLPAGPAQAPRGAGTSAAARELFEESGVERRPGAIWRRPSPNAIVHVKGWVDMVFTVSVPASRDDAGGGRRRGAGGRLVPDGRPAAADRQHRRPARAVRHRPMGDVTSAPGATPSPESTPSPAATPSPAGATGAGAVCAVVLAAGEGRRLRPLTELRPKALCPVGNVPLLDRALARVAGWPAGPRTVAVNAAYLGRSDRRARRRPGARVGRAGRPARHRRRHRQPQGLDRRPGRAGRQRRRLPRPTRRARPARTSRRCWTVGPADGPDADPAEPARRAPVGSAAAASPASHCCPGRYVRESCRPRPANWSARSGARPRPPASLN